MQSHYRSMGMRQRDEEEEYEREDYDEYETEGEEEEEEEEEGGGRKEEEMPSKEQQDFLKLREQLKEKFRQKLKKQTASAFKGQGHSGGQSQQDRFRRPAPTNDKFGSFFGPSQPVIASRVIDESRSIRETKHIISRVPTPSSGSVNGSASTSSEKKAHVPYQQPRVNEVKKKAQTLKDMRDYSFLLSDDADFPDPVEERQQKPSSRNASAPNSDGRSAQASSKTKPTMGQPGRMVPNGHELKRPVSRTSQPQARVGPLKGAAVGKSRPVASESRKVVSSNAANGSGQRVGHKSVPSKVPAPVAGANRPPARAMNDPSYKKKLPSAVPHSSTQRNHDSEQRRPSEGSNKMKAASKQPLPSSKPQLSKQIPQRSMEGDRIKKKPMKRRFDEEDDGENAIQMIRDMFRYNPNRYAGVDEDVSDMEADFRQIQKEEFRSSRIAKMEDEEQLRLIEEEERRERMRKKQKLRR